MHDSFSNHNESIHAHASQIWSRHYRWLYTNFRPSLNIRQLVTLIQIATGEDDLDSSMLSTGKKRSAAVLSNHQDVRPSKRVKMIDGTVTQGVSKTSDDDDFVWPLVLYPHLSSETEQHNKSLRDVEAIPIFQHVSEIQYSRLAPESMVVGGDKAMHSEWNSEEQYLTKIIANLCNSISEPRTIDLGIIHFSEHHGRLIAKGRSGWLLLLPSLPSDIDLEWHDIASQSVEDILMAFYILQSAGRARMDGRLHIIVHPSKDDSTPQQELPFQLQVVTNVSFLLPSIFEPFTGRGTRQTSSEVGDAQRRVLNFLYPSAATTPDTFDGTINIPFFYSVLRPAKLAISPATLESAQPVDLIPTLLPFQRRSVAWLLHREGKTISVDGKVVPKSAEEDFTLWDKVEEGNYTWYVHRLSGLLSPAPPEMPPVLGGILAEEPGLGKTLEIIALILLNPAPLDRNPTVKRWDPEAKLEVRAIKVCIPLPLQERM
jgi:E3 ubiquitin-protein ligase SHPRH